MTAGSTSRLASALVLCAVARAASTGVCAAARAAAMAAGVRAPDELPLPQLVIFGVQKSGTSALRMALIHSGSDVCASTLVEARFFDRREARARPFPASAVRVYSRLWRNCPAGALRFEKTPSYYFAPQVPQRMCEVLSPGFKLAVVLREPAARAFSSFWTGLYFLRPWLEPIFGARHQRNASSFDLVARVDAQIVRRCGGLPAGHFAIAPLERASQAAAEEEYRACCDAVVSAHRGISRHAPWPGCACPRLEDHYCVAYGDRRAHQVRTGIYASYLRPWLRLFAPGAQLQIIDFARMVADPIGAANELVRFARGEAPSPRNHLAARQPAGAGGGPGGGRYNPTRKINSRAVGRMLDGTARMLHGFYAPFNRELFDLIGRELDGWSTPRPAAFQNFQKFPHPGFWGL
jgi:hypothetical protein